MFFKKYTLIVVIFIAVMIAACDKVGTDDIVGRWEPPEDVAVDVAWEFYADGTGVSFIGPFDVTDFTYTLAEDGTLMRTISAGSEKRTFELQVTFNSTDEILMNYEGPGEPRAFVRKPLPALPPHARVALSTTFFDQTHSILDAEQIDDLQAIMAEDQRVVFESDLQIPPDEVLETWMATVQVEEEEPQELILQCTDTPLSERLIWAVGRLTETFQGQLVGVQLSFSLDDAADGTIESSEFGGVIVVELEDGRKVDAISDEILWDQLKGGQTLEVVPIEGSEYWRVLRIAE